MPVNGLVVKATTRYGIKMARKLDTGSVVVSMRFPPTLLRDLRLYCRLQPDKPSQAAAMRFLLGEALAVRLPELTAARPARKRSSP